ncbi:hypothetical protein RvY_06843-2 [Ramazzottius varieornatus]|uniref:Uncharacterized protein n=1 Tax=Ramazzottius varieornatus TaxID=947166 RepID=A0A1D1V681_RAMVA|nr:hypothetical protein RvY_06843-2 [Ramazzottius varieornatus]
MDDELVFKWYPKPRNYVREAREHGLQRTPARTHPLASTPKATGVTTNGTTSKPSTAPKPDQTTPQTVTKKTATFVDPLLAMADTAEYPSMPPSFKTPLRKIDGMLTKEELVGPWNIKKEAILTQYTTTEKMTFSSSFLPGEEKVAPIVTARSASVAGKIQSRLESLEQLDNVEVGTVKEVLNLTQQEYIARLDQLHHKLQAAWRDDQRVTALKIAIQLAKLLSDTAPLSFYPSKFVLITEVLETFGQLVHDRIQEKAESGHNDNQNLEFAKETCRNWFFKVASVRELLPRIYIEISLMRCVRFVEPRAADGEMIQRFVKMIRGIGDHLVASYVRCYLARMIGQLAPEMTHQLGFLLEDFANLTAQVRPEVLERSTKAEKFDVSSYWLLHQPALEWITESYGKEMGEQGLETVFSLADKSRNCKGLLLNCALTSFDPLLVTKNPIRICGLIQQNIQEFFPTYMLCRNFGLCLLNGDNDQKERKKVLNEIFPLIIAQKNSTRYISAVEVWTEYAAKFFTAKEVNRILADIIDHLTPDRAYHNCPSALLRILERIVRHLRSFVVLLSMDKFMPFMDMLQQDEVRLKAAKVLLEAFGKYERDDNMDVVVVDGVLFASKILHDSITSLSSQDEKRNAADLILQ